MSRQGPALIEQQGPGPGSSKSRYLSRKTCTLFVQAELKQFPRISRWAVVGAETGVSVMQNQVDIDHKHSRAICQEIGERLQAYLRVELELPASLKKQLDQLHQLESQSPSIVPDVEHSFENEASRGDARGGEQFRFTWPWRRKK